MRTPAATDLARLAAPALIGAAVFAGVGTFGAAAPASAASGACSGTSGVTVVVQFPSGSATGCAPGSPGTALNALRSAGFATTGVVGYGDAAICSINGYPVKTMCPRMPPGNAYWAVFSAKRGGAWAYASLGAASLPAPFGSVVGFRFGSGAAPTTAVPKAVSTPKPSASKPSGPKPTTPKPTACATSSGAASKPSSRGSASSNGAKANGSAHRSSADGVHRESRSSAAPSTASRTSSAASTTAPQPTASGTASGQGATHNPTVTSTKVVEKDGKKRKVVVFDDGSSLTLDPNSSDAMKYQVGVAKHGGKGAVAAPTSASVPQPSNSAHPGISTSGSVPGLPVPEAKGSGGGNMAGVLTGVGVLGVATAGAAYTALRRRG